MQCPFCSRASRRTDWCEWCRKPLTSPQPPQNVGPQALSQSPIPMPPAVAPTAGYTPTPPAVNMYQAAQPTVGMPPAAPASGTQYRTTLSGEVLEVPETTAAMPPMPGHMPPGMPPAPGARLGVGTSASTYLPPSAISAQMLKEQLRDQGPSLGEGWEKCLAMALPLLVVSMLLVHFVPSAIF
ncbi:MAG TPA: hypothetical protein VFB38_11140 [Chthonomonadaceae bacterium]|nr:hypothetical protein [Chthonomonadaceae bacterium]